MALKLDANMTDADGFYDELLKAHEGLDQTQSEGFNARLILILANHIGDSGVLKQAIHAAGKRNALSSAQTSQTS